MIELRPISGNIYIRAVPFMFVPSDLLTQVIRGRLTCHRQVGPGKYYDVDVRVSGCGGVCTRSSRTQFIRSKFQLSSWFRFIICFIFYSQLFTLGPIILSVY